MCLNPRWLSFWPYNRTKIRWKVLFAMHGSLAMRSIYHGDAWRVGEWRQAENKGSLFTPVRDVGFHVYVDKPMIKQNNLTQPFTDDEYERAVVVELRVEEFVASGKYDGDKCETWRKAKIEKVFDNKGMDITSEYISLTNKLKKRKKHGNTGL